MQNSLDTDSHTLQYKQAMAYKRHHQYSEAILAFEQFLKSQPSHPRGHYHLGVCYQQTEQEQLALASFCRSLDLSPSQASYHKRKTHEAFFNRFTHLITHLILVGLAPQAQLVYQQYLRCIDSTLLDPILQLRWHMTQFTLLVHQGFIDLAFEGLLLRFNALPTTHPSKGEFLEEIFHKYLYYGYLAKAFDLLVKETSVTNPRHAWLWLLLLSNYTKSNAQLNQPLDFSGIDFATIYQVAEASDDVTVRHYALKAHIESALDAEQFELAQTLEKQLRQSCKTHHLPCPDFYFLELYQNNQLPPASFMPLALANIDSLDSLREFFRVLVSLAERFFPSMGHQPSTDAYLSPLNPLDPALVSEISPSNNRRDFTPKMIELEIMLLGYQQGVDPRFLSYLITLLANKYHGLTQQGNLYAYQSEHRIPKVIMQYWDKPTPPAEVMRCIESWQRHYPDFEHILFNKETAIAFIKAHYGQTELAYFLACAHPAMECDLFRLLYLYQKGGHYMDADNLCLGRSPILTDLGHEGIFDIGSNNFYPMINNSMISCIPQHEVIRVTLNEIFKQPLTDFSVIKNTAAVTGPLKLTAAINIAIASHLNNFILLPIEQTNRFMTIPMLDYKTTALYWHNY